MMDVARNEAGPSVVISLDNSINKFVDLENGWAVPAAIAEIYSSSEL